MYLGVDKIYVINLKRHSLRKKSIQSLFSKIKTPFEFIEGIDWKDYSHNLNELHKYLGKEFFDPNGWFTYGVICCAISHRKAWKQFLESDGEFGLFFEDDIYATQHLYNFNFKKLNKQLKQLDWGVCYLGKLHEHHAKGKEVSDILYECPNFDTGQFAAHAYILNKKSAQWYYNITEKITYATDLRLEISPFNYLIPKNSLFIQRHKKLFPYAQNICENRKYLLEFFHHTTEDVGVGDDWNWDEYYSKTKSSDLITNENLPFNQIEKTKIVIKEKKLEGYKFYLNE